MYPITGYSCIAAVVVLLSSPNMSMAELQFDIDPNGLPHGHGDLQANARFWDVTEAFPAVISQGGVPFMYQLLFDCPGENAVNSWLESITLEFDCGQEHLVYTIHHERWQFLCSPGGESFFDPLEFGANPDVNCLGYQVNDLHLSIQGPILSLEWSPIWGNEGYRVYKLNYPAQPLQEATMISEQSGTSLLLSLEPGMDTGFFSVVTLYED